VINVIEDPAERREALINAWELTRKVLLVAAQVLINDVAEVSLPMAMESSPAATLSNTTSRKN